MKSYKYILYIVFALAACFATGCQSEDLTDPTQDGEILVSFRPELAADMSSRAIADGSGIDRVLVVVYENKVKKIRQEIVRTNGSFTNVSLRLLNGHEYQVLFWGYNSNCKAYQVNDNGTISVDYTNYLGGGFSKMEELDAFYCVKTVTVGEDYDNSATLYRAVAQLNFADNTKAALDGATATLSLTGIATSIDMLAPTPKGVNTSDAVKFSFNDFPAETLGDNRYVASVYLLPTVEPITADYSISTGLEVNGITGIKLEANKRTNVIGSIVESPSSEWGGETSEIQLVNDVYIIDTPEKLAYMQEPHQELESGKTFRVTKSFDMGNIPMTSLVVPDNSTFECEGNTISNLYIDGGLFGNATNLKVNNLKLENITITPATDLTHVGALVNILKGSSSFTDVTVKNAIVETSNGAAGGLIGYAVRKSEKDLNESFTVILSNCTTDNVSITGTQSEGYFVGMFSGYDKGETLTFTNCSKNNAPKAITSHYSEGNEATWTAGTDFSTYNAYLGKEVYYRGIINYGATRFIPAWDGETKVVPLTENGYELIWSPFDLANLQGKSPANVLFKQDVDLAGDRVSKKNAFTPILQITKHLNGDGKTLYNLYVEVDDMGGFIAQGAGSQIHENLTFENSAVVVHFVTLNGEDRGYAGTLTPVVWSGTGYTVRNIKINNSYVFGLGKIGGLIGYIDGGTTASTIKDCTVTGTTVKNEKGKTQELFEKSAAGQTVSMKFYAHGEAGGLLGMLMGNCAISNCHVTNSTMDCYGEANQSQKVFWVVTVTVQGRHVNNFIGNIRTPGYWIGDTQYSNVITIDGCSATNNTYITTDGKRKDDPYKKSSRVTTNLVGEPYYLNVARIVQVDPKGSVKIDGIEFL